MSRALKFTALSLGVLLAFPAQGNARYNPNAPSTAIAAYGFRETGETRRCLTYTELDGVLQIATGEFLFSMDGKGYLNKTLSSCTFYEGQDTRVGFKLETGNVCRNTIMYVSRNRGRGWTRSRCTLGEFRELEPVAEQTPSDEQQQ